MDLGQVLVLSIVVRLVALGWSLLLLRRTRDWRMAFVALMVVLMVTRQSLSLAALTSSGSSWLEGGMTELPGLVVSGMVLLAVVFLGRMLADRARGEEQLSASEAHYRVLAQQARDMIFVIDPEGNYTYVSSAFERMVGMAPEQVIGTSAIERSVNPQIIRTERRLLGRALAGDLDEVTFESELRHVDGRVIPTEVIASVIRDEDGQLIAVQGAARDITERRRVEAALHESERKYREVVETTHELIVRADIEGVVEFVNPALVRTLGYQPDEVLGRSIFDFLVAENVEADRATFQESVQTGGLVSFFETVALHKSGARVYLSVTVRPVFDEKEPGVVGTTLTVADITERRMAEDAQRESEVRYRTLLDNVPLAVAAIDRRGRLVAANPQLVSLAGAPSVEAMMGRVDALGGPILSTVGLTDVARRCMNQAESGTVDVEWVTNWGNRMDVRVHYAPHRNSQGRILGALAIIEDVTALRDAEQERRRLEGALQQAQKMEAVGTLAGGIAHDFNNLLTGICGGLELGLLDVPRDSAAAENLRHASTAAERAMELTQQLLTLSRRQEPTMAPTDVNEVVERIERLLRRSIPEVIEVFTALGPDMPTIRADAGQLEQALLNLGINARDAITDGHGKITFATEVVEIGAAEARIQGSVAPGSYIRVTVTDSGVGMAADVVDRAFEPFYTTKGQGKGTGLGLAMVYTCMKAHEGWVDVESEPGFGTSIRLHLPMIEFASLPRVEGEKRTPHGDETILLVDDQETVLRVGRRMLERCGYEVVTARDGREALERFAERGDDIDLVLADLMMPRCDGRELLKGLRARGASVPVVLASGYAPDTVREDLMAEGFIAFLTKPFQLSTLATTIRRALDDEVSGHE